MPLASPEIQLPDTKVLLIVPPLAHLSWPSLGVHLLQAVAEAGGHSVGVLYANLWFGARIGALEYANLSNAPGDWLMGERLFAGPAFGRDGLALAAFEEELAAHNQRTPNRATRYLDHLSDATGKQWAHWGTRYSLDELSGFAAAAQDLVSELGEAIAAKGYSVVGATTSFDQTNAAIALLGEVKRRSPAVWTLLGGANCEGEMADGLLGLSEHVDRVFAGESEETFSRFLDELKGDAKDARPELVRGSPCQELDDLPAPVFDDYFEQLDAWLPEMKEDPLWLSYETSRGCWWGEKRHCTFCGLNGLGMGFRKKSPERVLADLKPMLERYPTHYVCMTDNIMPHEYHRTLIPRMKAELPEAHVFYEQKANLTLAQVEGMWEAGIKVIQPGIESLSSPVLRLMRKGVLARQNLALLRYARAVGMTVKWNLLYGFPGDAAVHYAEMLELVPLLHHLSPPNALTHLSIDRFSPYFDEPDAHGLSDIRPLPVYAEVFPEGADVAKLAYHFQASWRSGALEAPQLMVELWRAILSWRAAWSEGQPPTLQLTAHGANQWALLDTRDGGQRLFFLSPGQAAAVAVGGPLDRVPAANWAFRNRFAVMLDDWCVPLALARAPVLQELEQRFGLEEEWCTVLRASAV